MKLSLSTKQVVYLLLGIMIISFILAGVFLVMTGGIPAILEEIELERTVNEEHVFDLEGIENITVETNSTDINFIPTNEKELKIHYHGKASSKYYNRTKELKVNQQSKTIDIAITNRITFGFDISEFQLDVYIPRTYSGNIAVDTSSADTKINDLAINNFNYKSSSGDLDLDSVTVVKSSIKASSGRIRCEGFSSDIEVESTSGYIDLVFEKFDNDVVVTSSSGDVRIILNKESEFHLIAKTSSGKIINHFPITISGKAYEDKLEGSIGDSDNIIDIKTKSGDIEISN